jgi:hypothetical protein
MCTLRRFTSNGQAKNSHDLHHTTISQPESGNLHGNRVASMKLTLKLLEYYSVYYEFSTMYFRSYFNQLYPLGCCIQLSNKAMIQPCTNKTRLNASPMIPYRAVSAKILNAAATSMRKSA